MHGIYNFFFSFSPFYNRNHEADDIVLKNEKQSRFHGISIAKGRPMRLPTYSPNTILRTFQNIVSVGAEINDSDLPSADTFTSFSYPLIVSLQIPIYENSVSGAC